MCVFLANLSFALRVPTMNLAIGMKTHNTFSSPQNKGTVEP